jgi:hypothetical protein
MDTDAAAATLLGSSGPAGPGASGLDAGVPQVLASLSLPGAP